MSEKNLKRKLGVLIVNWNCGEKILLCLRSVKKAGYIENVVVVDNGSDDESLEEIRKQKFGIRIIENKKNLGFAEGNNVGIRYLMETGVQFVFILNPDTEMGENTIPVLIDYLEKEKEAGIAGSKILAPSGGDLRLWSCGGALDKKRYSGGLVGYGEIDSGQYDKIKEADYIPGTAMMVKREVFEKCGLFYSPYFVYYEDVEFSLKAQQSGFMLMFVPKSVIIHHESSSAGKNSAVQEYYMARNHLLFVQRNAPLDIKLRELIRLPKTIYEHWQKSEKSALTGLKDYFAGRFGKRDHWS